MKTTISVEENVWKIINNHRRPNETFNDVLERLLNKEVEKNEK